MNADGFVAEGVTSNIFWVINKELYTPSPSTGILPGITRQHVLNLASSVNLIGDYIICTLHNRKEAQR